MRRVERVLIADVLRERWRTVLAGCSAATVHQICEALMNILTADTKATAEVIRWLAYAVSGCAGLAVTVVVLLRIDLWLGLGIIVVVPALMVCIDRIGPWLEHKVHARQQASG